MLRLCGIRRWQNGWSNLKRYSTLAPSPSQLPNLPSTLGPSLFFFFLTKISSPLLFRFNHISPSPPSTALVEKKIINSPLKTVLCFDIILILFSSLFSFLISLFSSIDFRPRILERFSFLFSLCAGSSVSFLSDRHTTVSTLFTRQQFCLN
jgi:hypothetical protein